MYANTKKSKNRQQTSKTNNKSKGPRCCSCNEYGHYANKCPNEKKKTNKREETSNFIAAFSGESSEKWYIDSGASMHMCSNKDWMYDVSEPSVKTITVTNREPLSVKGIGSIYINISQNSKIQVRNVLYVPGLATNLLSVSTIVTGGYKVIFNVKDVTFLTNIKRLYVLLL